MPSPAIERGAALALLLFLVLPGGVASAQPRAAMEAPLDEVGYATAMGGADGTAIRGGHRALPVPSYVEVTALASGRTVLVEIAERGGEAPGEVIALSCGALRQLGLSALPAPVRVRRVSPPDQERTTLAQGRMAAARLDAPEGLLSALRRKLPAAPRSPGGGDCGLPPSASPAAVRPPETVPPARKTQAFPDKPARTASAPSSPAPKPPVPRPGAEKARPPAPAAQPPKGPGYVIQVAALSSRARADALARSIGGHVQGAGSVFRVRKGPYPTEAAARAALPPIRAKGFADARVIPNEGR
ncbi:MAG: SPOR domain-containing protein [Sphingobium sp.]